MSKSYPLPILNNLHGTDWDDRPALQNKWTLQEKGWLIDVEWKQTPFGLGAFAAQDVKQGTQVRVGIKGKNLVTFSSRRDIHDFLTDGDKLTKDDPEYQARVRYLSDYLFGNDQSVDMNGNTIHGVKESDKWIYCIGIPGFGTNHSENPNVKIYNLRVHQDSEDVVVMAALRDIRKGDEICNSYSYCGPAPSFVKDFAKDHDVSMVFPGCNDFVKE